MTTREAIPGLVVQPLTPTFTWHRHLGRRDAELFVQFYRGSIQRAVRFVQLHDKLRGLVHGDRMDFPPLNVLELTNTEACRTSMDIAKAAVMALLNPCDAITCPEIADVADTDSKVEVAHATPHLPVVDFVVITEGKMLSHGLRPYVNPKTKVPTGTQSYAVDVEGAGRLYGQDLMRALRVVDACAGDRIRLLKSKHKVSLGDGRSHRMNLWEVVVLERGPHYVPLDATDPRALKLIAG